jgi:hypothetical protein
MGFPGGDFLARARSTKHWRSKTLIAHGAPARKSVISVMLRPSERLRVHDRLIAGAEERCIAAQEDLFVARAIGNPVEKLSRTAEIAEDTLRFLRDHRRTIIADISFQRLLY